MTNILQGLHNLEPIEGDIAFLKDKSLEVSDQGFPPNPPNLISAIETWLKEI